MAKNRCLICVRSSVSETCVKKVPFQVFLLREGFLSLLVGNLDDPKVLARYLEDTNGWETFL